MSSSVSTITTGDSTSSTLSSGGSKKNKKWKGGKSNKSTESTFRSKVKGIETAVFVTKAEGPINTFKAVVEDLQVHFTQIYEDHIIEIEYVFENYDLKPMVYPPEPKITRKKQIKKPDGTITESSTEMETIIAPPTSREFLVYKQNVEALAKKEALLPNIYRAVYIVVWNQCSQPLKAKIKSLKEPYQKVETSKNPGHLLKLIRDAMQDFDGRAPIVVSVTDALALTFSYYQQDTVELDDHLKTFINMKDSLANFDIDVGQFEVLVKYEKKKDDDAGVKTRPSEDVYKERARNRFFGYLFLRSTNHKKRGPILEDLEKDYAKGLDHYPEDVQSAYDLLLPYYTKAVAQLKRKERQDKITTGEQHHMEMVAGIDHESGAEKAILPNAICHHCKKPGHIRPACPDTYQGAEQHHLEGIVEVDDSWDVDPDGTVRYDMQSNHSDACIFLQFNDALSPPTQTSTFTHRLPTMTEADRDRLFMLDSGSNFSVMRNRKCVKNIRKSDTFLRAYTNGGTMKDSHYKGDVDGLFEVWINEVSRLNIFALCEMRKHFRITMDSLYAAAFNVHISATEIWRFFEYSSGLYFHDPADPTHKIIKDIDHQHENYSCESFHSSILQLNPYHQTPEELECYHQTVEELMSQYTKRQLRDVDRARRFYECRNFQSYATLISDLEHNAIRDCPVTVDDVKRLMAIEGAKHVAYIKGKTKRKPVPHVDLTHIDIPPSILDLHSKVLLTGDIFKVLGCFFALTLSRDYKYTTVSHVSQQVKASELASTVNQTLNIYKKRDLTVTMFRADNQYKAAESLIDCPTDICSAGEHVPEIEREIQTFKEHIRATVHYLPFRKYPKLLTEGLVRFTNRRRNERPCPSGLSRFLSPRTLITGKPAPSYHDIVKVSFGDYCQVSELDNVTNTANSRTVGAIALYPDEGDSGGWYFMSLATGRRLHRLQCTVLPTPTDAIVQVHDLADRENAPLAARNHLFEYRGQIEEVNFPAVHPLLPLPTVDPTDYPALAPEEHVVMDPVPAIAASDLDEDVEDDDVSAPSLVAERADDANTTDDSIHEDQRANEEEDNYAEEPTNNPFFNFLPDDEFDENDENNDDDMIIDSNESEQHPLPLHNPILGPVLQDIPLPNDDDIPVDDDPTDHPIEDPIIDLEPQQTPIPTNAVLGDTDTTPRPYNLRNTTPRNYRNMHHGIQHFQTGEVVTEHNDLFLSAMSSIQKLVEQQDSKVERECHVQDASPSQDTSPPNLPDYGAHYGISPAIRAYGKEGEEALLKEFGQFHALKTFVPIDSKSISQEQKKRALRMIIITLRKRCGRLKSRGVVDGSVQRAYIPKNRSYAPAVGTDGMLLTCLQAATEKRHVYSFDVAGAFLHGTVDELVIMRLTGPAVDLMCKLDPEYGNFITYERGIKVVYVQLLKSMYGLMRAAIIWYTLFSTSLKKMGFKINPYDPCVANCMINGKQCTICWYVDDCLISHVDKKVIMNIIQRLEDQFGKMTVTEGNVHTYIGMQLTFRPDGKLAINMSDYLKECIDDFELLDTLISRANTPALRNLFEIKEDDEVLEDKKREAFHSIVYKLLFVSLRARLDIQLPISFLSSRVTKSTKSDWDKLKRLLSYIKSTIDMPRIIGADLFPILRTWTDVSYAVHKDMRCHTGSASSLGHGVIGTASEKQKLNTKSSTEGETVGASDTIGISMWIKRFMNAQGWELKDHVFYQDNESAIKLEQNGLQSSGKKTKHIDIRYFFIKDVLTRENIKLEHCPTEHMLADFFTKPLQGKLFRAMRDVIMGHETIDYLKSNFTRVPSTSKERVDQKINDAKNMTSLNHLQKTYAAICATPVGQIIKNVKNKMNVKLEVLKRCEAL